MNQKTKSLHTDSKHLGVSGEEVWVCGYVHMCTPVERGVGDSTWLSHLDVSGGGGGGDRGGHTR